MPAKAKSKKAEDAVIEKGTMAAAEPETKAAEEVLTQPKKATAKKPAARKPRAKKVKAEAEVPAEAEASVETAPVMEQPAEEAAAEAAVSEAPAAEPAEGQAAAAQPKIEEVSEITVMPKKKILFVASESTPFIATGGLAEVIGSLSKALATNENYDVRVVIPLYSDISWDYRSKFKYLGNIFVPLAWRNQYCGIFSYEMNGVTFYFLDNEYYFKRPGCYGYYDDGERYAFFCRSVMEIMPFLNFYPEILHCHDWQAALAAIYLKTIYCFRPEYQYTRVLFTIHNIEYQGKYSLDILEDLFGISNSWKYLLEYNKCINLMKAAIECSEKFSTVSPHYAMEIKDPYYSHGLDPIVRRNEFKLVGILNGIDTEAYDPATDISIFSHYSIDNLEPKKRCKEELQKMFNLPVKPDTPIIAVISRLVAHKGLDLVRTVIEEVLRQDVQVIILGKGDSSYENFFTDLSRRYVGKLVTIIAFNPDLSRKIYSGADLFLMPSKSEPCGLSQMIASRYGTVPIVRETGGLYDSIKPVGNGGNGFTFANYNAYDMLYVIREAINCYYNKDFWPELMRRVMSVDFSWQRSAREYEKVYGEMLK